MIGEIEDAILGRLRKAGDPAQGVLGYEWGKLESFPTDWEEQLAKGLIKTPAAFVTFGGWSDDVQGRAEVSVKARFGLIVMARNYRNQAAARKSVKAGEVGSYQLAQDAAALLIGQDLGLAIDGFEIGSLQFVSLPATLATRSLSALALELRTGFVVETSSYHPDAEFDGVFETLAATWDVPPFASTDNHLQPDLLTTQILPTEET